MPDQWSDHKHSFVYGSFKTPSLLHDVGQICGWCQRLTKVLECDAIQRTQHYEACHRVVRESSKLWTEAQCRLGSQKVCQRLAPLPRVQRWNHARACLKQLCHPCSEAHLQHPLPKLCHCIPGFASAASLKVWCFQASQLASFIVFFFLWTDGLGSLET